MTRSPSTVQRVEELLNQGHSHRQTAKELGITREYVTRLAARFRDRPKSLRERCEQLRANGVPWRSVAQYTHCDLELLQRLAAEWGMAWDNSVPYARRAKKEEEVRHITRCTDCGGRRHPDIPHECRRRFHPIILGAS